MKRQNSFVKSVFLICLVLGFGSYSAKGTIWLDDGGVHPINYPVAEEIQVWDSSTNAPTTANFYTGSSAPAVKVYANSIVNAFGGSLFDLHGRDNSTVNISGTTSQNVWSLESSKIQISGSAVINIVNAYNNSQISISGGTIGSTYADLRAMDSSKITLTGGAFTGRILAEENGEITIAGGNIQKHWDGSAVLGAWDNAKIIIDGSHFRINDNYVGYGRIDTLGYSTGTLSGKLLNGDTLNVDFNNGDHIYLVPEPATLLLLGLGVMSLRKKRKV